MGLKRKLDDAFQVMLCDDGTVKDLDRKDYVADLKADGTLGVIERTLEGFRIYGRKGLEYTETLPELTEQFSQIPMLFRILCEIVYIDREGRMVFHGSQKRCQISNSKKVEEYRRKYPVGVFAFDIVMVNGMDLTNAQYITRRGILEHFYYMNKILHGLGNMRLTPTSRGNGQSNTEFYGEAVEKGYEGVVLKRVDGKYVCGKRSRNFIKVKARDHTPYLLRDRVTVKV